MEKEPCLLEPRLCMSEFHLHNAIVIRLLREVLLHFEPKRNEDFGSLPPMFHLIPVLRANYQQLLRAFLWAPKTRSPFIHHSFVNNHAQITSIQHGFFKKVTEQSPRALNLLALVKLSIRGCMPLMISAFATLSESQTLAANSTKRLSKSFVRQTF